MVVCAEEGLMATAIVTSKGQVTVPIEVRKQMGLRMGDQIVFTKLPGTGNYALDEIDKAIGEQIAIENDLD